MWRHISIMLFCSENAESVYTCTQQQFPAPQLLNYSGVQVSASRNHTLLCEKAASSCFD